MSDFRINLNSKINESKKIFYHSKSAQAGYDTRSIFLSGVKQV